MKPRLWLLAIVLAVLAINWCRQGAPISASAGPAPAPSSRPKPVDARLLVGAGSCAAAACHNANFIHGDTGSEYTTWITKDAHARAYEVLFADRSNRIQRNLHSSTPASKEPRCLACHVHPNLDWSKPPPHAPYFKTDGVSCETCHGAAKNWLSEHYLDTWQSKSREEKQQLGMADTQSIQGRVKLCVGCHVGVPGMDVDHDLIAAGHPRLNFEFAAFNAAMPHHWPDAKDRNPPRGDADFEAQAWTAGQLATAQAALELLAHRAGDQSKPWPEFAEHDCFACHHDLQSQISRQKVGKGERKLGAFPWGNYATMTPALLKMQPNQDTAKLATLLQEIRKAMESTNSKRKDVADRAGAAALLLEKWAAKPHHQIPIEHLLRDSMKMNVADSWDRQTQRNLTIAALLRAGQDMNLSVPADLGEAIRKSSRNLDQSKIYDGDAIHKRLLELTK